MTRALSHGQARRGERAEWNACARSNRATHMSESSHGTQRRGQFALFDVDSKLESGQSRCVTDITVGEQGSAVEFSSLAEASFGELEFVRQGRGVEDFRASASSDVELAALGCASRALSSELVTVYSNGGLFA